MDSSVEARLEDCRSQSALRDMGVATSGGEHHLLRSSSSMCRQVTMPCLRGRSLVHHLLVVVRG